MTQRFRALQELGEQFERASLVGSHTRKRVLWPLVGAAGAALAAAIATALVLLSSGTTVAYANWAPVPSTASPAALKAALAKCYGVDRQGSGLGKPVVTEARGRSTAAVYVIDSTVYMCRYDSAFSAVTDDSMGPLRTAPGPGQLSIPYGVYGGGGSERIPKRLVKALNHVPRTRATELAFSEFETGGGYGYWAVGRAGSQVAAVTFGFAKHQRVTATVEHGWYFAWWPWTSDPSTVTVRTSHGSVSSPMKDAWPGPGGSRPYPACEPGAAGCAFVKTPPLAAKTSKAVHGLAAIAQQCDAFTLETHSLPANVFRTKPVVTEVHGIFTALVNVTDGKVYLCTVGGNQQNIRYFFIQRIEAFGPVRKPPGPDQLSVPAWGREGGGSGRTGGIGTPKALVRGPGHRRPGSHVLSAQMQSRMQLLNVGGYGPYSLGQVGSAVSAVSFKFANGKSVAATVGNGWYFAWWPWFSQPRLVTVTTQTGTITARVTGGSYGGQTIRQGCKPGSTGCVFVRNAPEHAG